MDSNLRKVWTEVVTSEDLDRHLLQVGQAQTNAALLVEMFADSSLPSGAELLLVGVGTGQFLDFVGADVLARFHLTCTDINEKFLAALKGRLLRAPTLSASVCLDDIEQTTLIGPFDGAAAVLVLEHIEWKKGIASLVKLGPAWLYFVIQRNDVAQHMVALERELAPSIREASAIATPAQVSEGELTGVLGESSYSFYKRYERAVPDNKTMVGLIYRRATADSDQPFDAPS